jgi:hypothetical protein
MKRLAQLQIGDNGSLSRCLRTVMKGGDDDNDGSSSSRRETCVAPGDMNRAESRLRHSATANKPMPQHRL